MADFLPRLHSHGSQRFKAMADAELTVLGARITARRPIERSGQASDQREPQSI